MKQQKTLTVQTYYRPTAVRRTRTVIFDYEKYPSLVDQSQTADADINTIVARFLQKGIVPQLNQSGIYADTTQFPDLQAATQAIIEAQNIFSSLPAIVRETFHNDPQMFFEYLKGNHVQLDEYLRNPKNFVAPKQDSSPAPNDDAIKRDDKQSKEAVKQEQEKNKT